MEANHHLQKITVLGSLNFMAGVNIPYVYVYHLTEIEYLLKAPCPLLPMNSDQKHLTLSQSFGAVFPTISRSHLQFYSDTFLIGLK